MKPVRIQAEAENFLLRWNEKFSHRAALHLDFSWPALSVIDLLCYQSRGQESFDSYDEEFLRGASCVLGVIAEKCWSEFAGEVVLENSDGVVVRGVHTKTGLQMNYSVERTLRSVIQRVPRELEVFCDAFRVLRGDDAILPLLGVGTVTALNASGAPGERKDMEEEVQSALRVLARDAARYYGFRFPEEPLGQVAELYLDGLIYPPMLVDESLPGKNAIDGILRFQKEYQVSKEALLRLGENLALFPDDLMSSVGVLLVAALTENLPPVNIIAASQRRGTFIGLLRSAMVQVRTEFGLRKDWMFQVEIEDEDLRRFALEKALGFLPWVELPAERLRDRSLAPIYHALSEFDYGLGMELLELRLAEEPQDIDLRLQKIVLFVVNSEFERAIEEIRALFTEPDADGDSRLYEQLGVCYLGLGKFGEAVQTYERASKVVSLRKETVPMYHNYCWALMMIGKFEKALSMLDQVLPFDSCPVTGWLNKAYCLRSLGKDGEALKVEAALQDLSPYDKRVFGNMLVGALS